MGASPGAYVFKRNGRVAYVGRSDSDVDARERQSWGQGDYDLTSTIYPTSSARQAFLLECRLFHRPTNGILAFLTEQVGAAPLWDVLGDSGHLQAPSVGMKCGIRLYCRGWTHESQVNPVSSSSLGYLALSSASVGSLSTDIGCVARNSSSAF
jgi:hypothetical protein